MRFFVTIGILFALSACATFAREQRICSVDHATEPVRNLMAEACEGNKSAQYKLGQMFEAGDGVEQNLELAYIYYKQAAQYHSGQTYIYVPGVGDAPGHVMPVSTGRSEPGHPCAKIRLGLMYRDGRGVKKNDKTAEKYLKSGTGLCPINRS